MTKRIQFSFETVDHVHINAYEWKIATFKDRPVRGLIQIAHGMAEHILRYDSFCQYLNEHDFIVFGNDHRGHGQTAPNMEDKGYFAEKDGFEKVVDDMKQLTMIMQKRYPGIPIFLFGHSMGSFLTRRYIQKYGDLVQGVILSGTGSDKGIVNKIGLLLAKLEVKRIGAKTPSPFLDQLTFGRYNKKFRPTRTKFDFLTRDKQIVDMYSADEECGFICSSSFFVDLISGLQTIQKQSEIIKTPRDLPIFFIAGDHDPVGDYGKGVRKVFNLYNHHCHHVNIKLYKNGRHEMINEINYEEVYNDIVSWLNKQLNTV